VGTRARRPFAPGVIAAFFDLKNAAHDVDPELSFVSPDKLASWTYSLAKKAAAPSLSIHAATGVPMSGVSSRRCTSRRR
jgi:hypothetical protein